MSTFRKTHTMTRLAAGSYVNGKWVEGGVASTFDIRASVQPLKANEIELLPEGRRESKAFWIYTSTMLNTLEGGANPDKMTLYGEDYEVLREAPWQNDVINHYQYLLVKITESDS